MPLPSGLYDQIINQLFQEKLAQEDLEKYYIGTKAIDRSNVADYLAQYLGGLFHQVLDGLPDDNDSVEAGIQLANSIISKLVQEFHLDMGNLIEKQKEILTAAFEALPFYVVV